MWLGATLSTILHVGPVVLLLVGLPIFTFAFSQDDKEVEKIDTNAQAGASKAKASAEIKSEQVEISRDSTEGQKTDETKTEDVGQSAPSFDIQIIPAEKIPPAVQKVIDRQTAALDQNVNQTQDKSRTEAPESAQKPKKTVSEKTKTISSKEKTKRVEKQTKKTEAVPIAKKENKQVSERKPNERRISSEKPVPVKKTNSEKSRTVKSETVQIAKTETSRKKTEKTKPIELAQKKTKPVEKSVEQITKKREQRTRRGGGGAQGTDDVGAGGGDVGNSGGGQGKEYGALLSPSQPIRSAKTLTSILEEENPQLLRDTSRTPAGNQTRARKKRQERIFKRVERAAKSGHANAQLNVAKLLMRGQGAEQDFDAARKWIEKAADRGYVSAQVLLGYLYTKPGPAQDLARADAWFWAAAAQGNKFAAAARKPLQRIMRSSEIFKSQRIRQEMKSLFSLLPINFGGGDEGEAKTKSNDKLRSSAARGEVKDLLDALLQGADVDGQDIDGKTALINAAWRGRREIIEILLDHGTDIEIADLRKRTPLMWGAINGQSAVVTTLINAGAELDIPDDENVTALMRAAWNGHLSIVNQLIAAGADPRRRDNNGLSAIDHAKREGHNTIVESLKIATQ
tara:strand:- start:15764 stop:17641 length:1878 start_codon:yes stop_codon:yes gene_type:complete